jgi:hypothetical protein
MTEEFSFLKSGAHTEKHNEEIRVCEQMENILQISVAGTEGGLQESEHNGCSAGQSEKVSRRVK